MGGTSLQGVPQEQKMLKGHLPRVVCHQVYNVNFFKKRKVECEISNKFATKGSGASRAYRSPKRDQLLCERLPDSYLRSRIPTNSKSNCGEWKGRFDTLGVSMAPAHTTISAPSLPSITFISPSCSPPSCAKHWIFKFVLVTRISGYRPPVYWGVATKPPEREKSRRTCLDTLVHVGLIWIHWL